MPSLSFQPKQKSRFHASGVEKASSFLGTSTQGIFFSRYKVALEVLGNTICVTFVLINKNRNKN